MNDRAKSIIARLGLLPHPEGGYFSEVYRSDSTVRPDDDRPERPSLTSVHFLLTRDDMSSWHVVRSDEVWHFYEGDSLELLVVDPATMSLSRKKLGRVGDGQAPVQIVPAGHWQAARTLGDYTLVGCTVGPGFVFEDFRLLRDDEVEGSKLRAAFPELTGLL